MSVSRNKSKSLLIILLLIVIAVGVTIPALRKNHPKPVSTTTPAKTKTTSKTTVEDTYVSTATFKYLLPDGWAKVAPSEIQAAGAVSGIATVSLPITQFRVAVEPASSSPSNITTLKAQTLAAIKQFQNFKLVSDGQIIVDGQTAQRYQYKFGGDSRTEQELIVLLYKKQAYSLLFTAPDVNFIKQQPTLDKISSSFQFL